MVVIASPQRGMSRHHFDDTAMAVTKSLTQNSSAANRRMIRMMHLNCWIISCVEGELFMGDTLGPTRPAALSLANRDGDYG
jgi:hypothetical protein